MVTIKALGGSSIFLSDGKSDVTVYPKKPGAKGIVLLMKPEEEPKGSTISWPGEYDVEGVAVRGIGQEEGQQVSYVLQMDGHRIAMPSSPLHEWSQADIERLGDVHVLILPAEDPKQAQSLIDEVDPRILILIPGSDGKVHQEVLKIAGAAGKETTNEYKLKGSLPAEGREVVVFNA